MLLLEFLFYRAIGKRQESRLYRAAPEPIPASWWHWARCRSVSSETQSPLKPQGLWTQSWAVLSSSGKFLLFKPLVIKLTYKAVSFSIVMGVKLSPQTKTRAYTSKKWGSPQNSVSVTLSLCLSLFVNWGLNSGPPPRPVLYHLSHTPPLFALGYFTR
jgi:hypothetical protein